jgi:hypothetical protein
MRRSHVPGRPYSSTAPRASPRRIAPAKLAAKVQHRAAEAKLKGQVEKRRVYSEAVVQHLEEVAEAHKQKKQGPSALDPALGEPTPMKEAKGKFKKNKLMRLMQLSALAVMSHPFGKELANWDTGVPVDCGAEWSREAIDLAIERGSHPTARAADAVALVHEDVAYQVKAGFTEVVYWDEIKDNLPKNFKVSPVAVIPQTGRRGRIILDLSFPVRRPPTKQESSSKRRRMGETIQESVNDTTKKLAPSEPVHAIGKVLPRLFHFMASTPKDQEIRLSKVDLSDGFWRLIVEPEQKHNFCYVMPDPPGARTRIVVPSALQMGWAESPGYFCAATETGRDIIDLLLREKVDLPEHPLEKFMEPVDTPKTAPPGADEHTSVGVYVDDYVLALVENEERTLIRRVSRATLHAIHSIFPPPEVSGHVGGKDPISRKKLEKGDARFDIEKEILGFLINGVDRTVRLSDAKAQAIADEIVKVLRKTHVPLKRFRSLLGKLQHAARILPAAKGMFSPLNKATRGDPKEVGVGKHSEVRAALLDLKHIVLSLATRPTHVSELVEHEAEMAGTCDASAAGAGGVWIGYGLQPTVWRLEWPADVVELYRKGTLTNSDLEMAGVLLQYLVAERLRPMAQCHTAIWSDNTPAANWSTKMADKATTPIAGQLLRALAMRQRTTCAALPTVTHYAGSQNLLADTASRSFSRFHHGSRRGQPSIFDTEFLTSFNDVFSLSHFSQMQSWRLVQPSSDMSSKVISTLLGEKLAMQQWTAMPERSTGETGVLGALGSNSTSSSLDSPKSNEYTSSWLSLPESVLELLVMADKSDLKPLPRPCAMSPKPLFWPASTTPEGPTPQTD